MRNKLIIMSLLVSLTACQQEAEPAEEPLRLDLAGVMGPAEGFLRAEQPREFNFPDDHGGHPGYRNEWWYLTGNLETGDGRHFGYQVTFFRISLRPPDGHEQESVSSWSSSDFWMAHAALTDVAAQEHRHLERFSRAGPGLAGVSLDPFRVWLENWQLFAIEGNDLPWQLTLSDDEFDLQLRLETEKAPVLQGVAGLSQKSPEPGNASYYYSLTRLQTDGTVRTEAGTYSVSGDSWLDREWSTSALAADQSGWDWFSLQFDDGQELMYYQLRDSEGQAHASSQGNWTDTAGQQTFVDFGDVSLQELRNWESPGGIVYTTEWQFSYQGQSWLIRAVLNEQFMDTAIPYWEGAIEIFDRQGSEQLGRGYLEMVRE